MTENTFGIWRRRFPVIKNLRCHHKRARKTIIATAVLHNLGYLWNDELVDDDGEQADAQPPPPPAYEVVDDVVDPEVIRERGKTVRDTLKARMPPRRPRERVRPY